MKLRIQTGHGWWKTSGEHRNHVIYLKKNVAMKWMYTHISFVNKVNNVKCITV